MNAKQACDTGRATRLVPTQHDGGQFGSMRSCAELTKGWSITAGGEHVWMPSWVLAIGQKRLKKNIGRIS